MNASPFRPERIVWICVGALGGVVLLSSPFLVRFGSRPLPLIEAEAGISSDPAEEPISFSLGLDEKSPTIPFPNLQGEILFSYDPPRPDGVSQSPCLRVRLKKTAQIRRVSLPCRLNLQYAPGEKLSFLEEESPFWVELSAAYGNQIEAKVYISSPHEEKIEAGGFLATPQEDGMQTPQEFPEKSPFRLLGEAHWWGPDLFLGRFQQSPPLHRLELGGQANSCLIEVQEGEWLVWREGKWEKSAALIDSQDKPIAKIHSASGKTLILEGWEGDNHILFSFSPAPGVAFKMRGEDLFSSIRVRSKKQISCMMEKQCVILKTGDWVLKTNGRWKVLRRKEDREAYLNGKIVGELFVFDQIEAKQGQKMICGDLFNPGRTQLVPIQIAAQGTPKLAKSEPKGSAK